ncbi:hypothetical protein BDA99DRAFT_539189 [Phascolomyces articulosus]|uniref:Uncharacterized protein n=1 Tax=Phascolomyces articulosus TaxID=60185 RepID=A0AAD5K7D3_9FUNG|nr:hypothetical protein BDA99DRAFT_539189 [Phascolomyces articulosus]
MPTLPVLSHPTYQGLCQLLVKSSLLLYFNYYSNVVPAENGDIVNDCSDIKALLYALGFLHEVRGYMSGLILSRIIYAETNYSSVYVRARRFREAIKWRKNVFSRIIHCNRKMINNGFDFTVSSKTNLLKLNNFTKTQQVFFLCFTAKYDAQ